MDIDQDTQRRLSSLRRQYFQLVEPPYFRWPDATILKRPSVQSWLYAALFDQENIPYPPPESYQLRVLKTLISRLEQAIEDPDEDEISDDLMSALSSIISSNLPSESTSAQQKAYVTYAYPYRNANNTTNDRTVTILEARSILSSSGTTGLRTWEAALFLGTYLASENGRALIRHKIVFELGAGTGMLTTLCAKHLDVAAICATDGDEAVVDAIRTNLFLNGLDDQQAQPVVRTAALKWGWPIDASTFAEDYGFQKLGDESGKAVPDVVLGADVTYDKSVIPRLVSTLREFFELNPALLVLIAATVRNEQTFETFANACRRNGFGMERIDASPVAEDLQDGPFYPATTPICIWQITRPQAMEDPFSI